MLGRSHLMLGGAGFLAIGAPVLSACGENLSIAELAAGTVVCAGAAMLPDIDHPQATCARSLGPVTGFISRVVSKLCGGHRNGTHSLLFAGLVTVAMAALLAGTSGPWAALIICFFFASLLMRVLTEASAPVSAALSALVAATLITIAPNQDWIYLSVGLGCLLHNLGDILTPEGVPPFWPISKHRVRIPVVGHTGDWREKVIASVCGLAMCWMMATMVFLPTWKESNNPQTSKTTTPPSKNKTTKANTSYSEPDMSDSYWLFKPLP
jgi:membrane-bound metal-dependent hydrolase YbcI (DUF457 family)